MELRHLTSPDYGVSSSGIYILDYDGLLVFAGPFGSEATAIGWITQRQEDLNRDRPVRGTPLH